MKSMHDVISRDNLTGGSPITFISCENLQTWEILKNNCILYESTEDKVKRLAGSSSKVQQIEKLPVLYASSSPRCIFLS